MFRGHIIIIILTTIHLIVHITLRRFRAHGAIMGTTHWWHTRTTGHTKVECCCGKRIHKSSRHHGGWWITYLSSLDLLGRQIGGFSGVQTYMLLQHQGIGVFLVTHRTLVEIAHGWPNFMHSHVGLQVTLCSKGPTANATLERSLPGVGAIMHLQSTLTRQHPIADNTLIGIGNLFVLHQLLEFHCFRGV